MNFGITGPQLYPYFNGTTTKDDIRSKIRHYPLNEQYDILSTLSNSCIHAVTGNSMRSAFVASINKGTIKETLELLRVYFGSNITVDEMLASPSPSAGSDQLTPTVIQPRWVRPPSVQSISTRPPVMQSSLPSVLPQNQTPAVKQQPEVMEHQSPVDEDMCGDVIVIEPIPQMEENESPSVETADQETADPETADPDTVAPPAMSSSSDGVYCGSNDSTSDVELVIDEGMCVMHVYDFASKTNNSCFVDCLS